MHGVLALTTPCYRVVFERAGGLGGMGVLREARGRAGVFFMTCGARCSSASVVVGTGAVVATAVCL